MLAGPQPFLAAGVLLLAPGLALATFLPAELTASAVRFTIVPLISAAISSVAIISASSAGIPITGLSVRLLLLALTLGSLAVQMMMGPRASPTRRAPFSQEAVVLVLLGAILCLGITLQALIVGGVPIPGQDWGHYLLYADQIRQKHSLLIDNPYWMLGGRLFGDDPGAPSLYAGYVLVSGQPTAVLAQGIWVFAAVAIVSVFTFVATLWGRAAGLIAAGLYAVMPMNLDMLAWHGLANVYALVLLPLVLLAVAMALRGATGWRWRVLLALGLVALAAAHRLTFLVTILTLLPCLGIAAWWRFRQTIRVAFTTVVLTLALGSGVIADLAQRNAATKGVQDYQAYLATKVPWNYVSRDLTTLLCVVGTLALGLVLVSRPLRRDGARLVLYGLLAAILGLSFGWIVHFPTNYTRAAYYLPLLLSAAIGIAWARLLPRFILGSTAVIAVVALQAHNLAPTLRSYYGYVNAGSLTGLDYVKAHSRPGDGVVTDGCWGFLSTWLLREPTLAAQDPSQILPEWEVEPARVARRVLYGGTSGARLARKMGVRFALIDPLCETDQPVVPLDLGRPIFTSGRLIVLDLGTTPSGRHVLGERPQTSLESAAPR